MGLSTTYTKTETDFLIQQLEEKISDKYNDESASIANDIIKFIDANTGENVNYRKTTTWHDGSPMDDTKVDGVIYCLFGQTFYKRVVEQYVYLNWWGDFKGRKADATDAINSVLKWASILGKKAYIEYSEYNVFTKNAIPEETYMGAVEAIRIPSNVEIKFNSSVIYSMTNNRDVYKIINFQNATNVKFDSVKVVGDRDSHVGTSGEWGYGVAFMNCSNIIFDKITAINCWGDGVYFGNIFHQANSVRSIENIHGNEIYVDNCRRNGVAITMGKNINIGSIISKNIIGANPQSGVDFECEYDGDLPLVFENINIGSIYTENCGIDGICLAMWKMGENPNKLWDINIGSFHDNGSQKALSSYNSKVNSNGNITINNFFAENNKQQAIYFYNKNSKSELIKINNFRVVNWQRVASGWWQKFAIAFQSDSLGTEKFGNIIIENIYLRGDSSEMNIVIKGIENAELMEFVFLDFWKVEGIWNGITSSEVTKIKFIDNNSQLSFS